MKSLNFGKSLQEHTEEELHRIIDNSNPRFGSLAQYELLRRLVARNEQASKRFAKWSLIIAVVAIIISIATSLLEIIIV